MIIANNQVKYYTIFSQYYVISIFSIIYTYINIIITIYIIYSIDERCIIVQSFKYRYKVPLIVICNQLQLQFQ